MKSRLEKVYNKLPNQKVDLKAQKLELNLTFDLATLGSSTDVILQRVSQSIAEIDRLMDEVEEAKNDLQSDFSELVSKTDELENTLIDTQDLATELGVEAKQINNFENSLDIYDQASAIIEMIKQGIYTR